jgi:hypothetical protein
MSDKSMTDEPDGKRWGWIRWAWIIIALLVLYTLSIGPAAWLDDRIDHTEAAWTSRIFGQVYWPLCCTADAIGLHNLLARYIDLFAPIQIRLPH